MRANRFLSILASLLLSLTIARGAHAQAAWVQGDTVTIKNLTGEMWITNVANTKIHLYTNTTSTGVGWDVLATTGDLQSIGGAGVADKIATLAGTGTTQADAAAIVSTVARVTAADGTVGVKLPALSGVNPGRQYTVINSSTASALKVYASGSDTITGQAGSTAISVAAKLFLRCWAYDTSNWYCEKGVLPY